MSARGLELYGRGRAARSVLPWVLPDVLSMLERGDEYLLDVQVVTMCGDTAASFRVGDAWTVADVKRAIEDSAAGHPLSAGQRLVYDQRELEDDERLGTLALPSGGAVVLQLVRVRAEVERALQELQDEDASAVVRRRAVDVFGRLGESAASHAPLLVGILSEPEEDRGVRLAVSKALGQMGAKVTPHVVRCLGDLDEYTRNAAAAVLSKIGVSALPYIVDCLGHSQPQTRVAALRAFANIGPMASTASTPVATCLEDSDPGVRIAAIETLVNIGEPALVDVAKHLGSQNLAARQAAVQVFRSSGMLAEPHCGALVTCLADDSTNILLKVEVCRVLEELGQLMVPHVLHLLYARDWGVRYSACKVLSGVTDLQLSPAHIERIKDISQDPNVILSAAAFDCLSRLSGKHSNLFQ